MSDTADLDALDALLQAATAHRKAQAARRQKHGDEWVQAGAFVDDAAARLFVALDAIDLPDLLRRVRLGDAAREVLEAEDALKAASKRMEECMSHEKQDAWRAYFDATRARDAARARYRALLETPR